MVPIYIVSLPNARRRRDHIRREMEKTNLPYTLIDAVDGKLLTQEEQSEYCDLEAIERNPQWLTPGAIGCALSHIHIYKRIADSNAPWALIAEDDIILPPNFESQIESIVQKSEGVDIVMLHYQSWKPLRLTKKDSVKSFGETGLYYPVSINDVLTTGAYLISKSAATRLAENLLPVRVSADSWGYFFEQGWVKSMRCTFPRMIEVAPLKSSIEYFRFPVVNFILKTIDRLRIPLLDNLLERRRLKQLKQREHVVLTDDPVKWQAK